MATAPATTVMRVMAVGRKAHELLTVREPRLELVATTNGAVFVRAAGELVWIVRAGAPLHRRAVLVASTLPTMVREVEALRVADLVPWHPPRVRTVRPRLLTEHVRRLLERLGDLGTPQGFGLLLTGRPLAFPLDATVPLIPPLAHACSTGAAQRAAEAARLLIGLGPGLTPSGDDLIGALFFIRILLAGSAAWKAAGAQVLAHAASATHPISTVLLGDLLDRHAYAPLHGLVCALAVGDDATAFGAARALVGLGHSSGWDMLTGLVIGLLGHDAPGAR